MRKSFEALWEVMEARRQQVEVGEVPLAYGFERTRQARRRAQSCPDEEALCGWVDGQLWRKSVLRWWTVWQHVQFRRCRECRAEITALAAAGQHGWLRLTWLASALQCLMVPLHLVKTPLAWASSAVVIMVGLSLWSLGIHGAFRTGANRSGAPVIEDMRTLPALDNGHSLDSQPEPIIWGD